MKKQEFLKNFRKTSIFKTVVYIIHKLKTPVKVDFKN